jgi:hypothetical protein
MALQLNRKQLQEVLKTEQGKTYTVLGITILTVLAMFILAIRPAWVSITNRMSENKTKQQYLKDADEHLAILDSLQTDKENYNTAISYLNTYLPQEPDESFVVRNLTEMAKSLNVQIAYLKIDKAIYPTNENVIILPNAEILGESKANITIEGDLNSFQKYIQGLENFGKLIDIENISYISMEDDAGNFTKWQMNIICYFYFWDINNLKSY